MEFTRNEIVLEQLRRVAAQYVSPEVLMSLRFEVRDLTGMLGKQVVMLIDLPKEACKTVKGETSYEFPASWFDHLRIRYFPRFLTTRFPIKYTTIKVPYEVEVGAVYPRLPKAFPSYGGDIRFYEIQRPQAFSMRVGEELEY